MFCKRTQLTNLISIAKGDEILAINGTGLEGLRHAQAIGFFKAIKTGSVALQVCRRLRRSQINPDKSRSCNDLLQETGDNDSWKLETFFLFFFSLKLSPWCQGPSRQWLILIRNHQAIFLQTVGMDSKLIFFPTLFSYFTSRYVTGNVHHLLRMLSLSFDDAGDILFNIYPTQQQQQKKTTLIYKVHLIDFCIVYICISPHFPSVR